MLLLSLGLLSQNFKNTHHHYTTSIQHWAYLLEATSDSLGSV